MERKQSFSSLDDDELVPTTTIRASEFEIFEVPEATPEQLLAWKKEMQRL